MSCRAAFDAAPQFLSASGLYSDWRAQAQACVGHGGRYLLFDAGLKEAMSRTNLQAENLRKILDWLEPLTSTTEAYAYELMPAGTIGCAWGSEIRHQTQCSDAYTSIEAAYSLTTTRGLQIGAWDGPPLRCSVQYDNAVFDQAPHWNEGESSDNNRAKTGEFRTICKTGGAGQRPRLGICAPSVCGQHDEEALAWHYVLRWVARLPAGHAPELPKPECARVLARLTSRDDIEATRVALPWSDPHVDVAPKPWDPSLIDVPEHGECGSGLLRILKQPYHRRVLVDPHRKIAFCLIPKVATMQFRQLFNVLNGFNISDRPWCCENLVPLELPSDSVCQWDSVAGRWNVTRTQLRRPCNGWRFAAFVRDPLERFVSTFIDMCTLSKPAESTLWAHYDLQDAGFNCLGPPWTWLRGWGSPPYEKSDKIRSFEQMADIGVPSFGMDKNDHWMLQSKAISKACGWDLSRLDFLGYLTKDRRETNRQVRSMLRDAFSLGAREAATLAERFFPADEPSESVIKRSHAGHREAPDYYRSDKILRKVMKYLIEDYSKLSIPLPQWDGVASMLDEYREAISEAREKQGLT